jgi:hypothetical protein
MGSVCLSVTLREAFLKGAERHGGCAQSWSRGFSGKRRVAVLLGRAPRSWVLLRACP